MELLHLFGQKWHKESQNYYNRDYCQQQRYFIKHPNLQLLKLKKNDKVPDLLTRNICLTILRQEIWNIKILQQLLLPFTIVLILAKT